VAGWRGWIGSVDADKPGLGQHGGVPSGKEIFRIEVVWRQGSEVV
jgi:hypothetical protein